MSAPHALHLAAATRRPSRRQFLAYAAATALAAPASALRAQTTLTPTPSSTEGPFYPQA